VDKINLLNLTFDELEKFLLEEGFKKFNVKQIYNWLHGKMIRNIDDMTNISKKNREILEEKCYIPFINLVSYKEYRDREEFIFELKDKSRIETTLFKSKKKNSLEIAVNVGDAVEFSLEEKSEYKFRRLELDEILNQIYTVNRRITKKGLRIDSLVFKKEVFSNTETLLTASKELSNSGGLNFPINKMIFSTFGDVKGIEVLLEKKIFPNLLIELHSVNDSVRDEIIPLNKNYPLEDVNTILHAYQKSSKTKINFKYKIAEGINFKNTDIDILCAFVRQFDHFLIILSPDSEEIKDGIQKRISSMIEYYDNENINYVLVK